MADKVQLYGNIDLMALRGARIVHNNEGVECIQIPIDIAKLKRSKNHLYLGYFTFPWNRYNYDFLTVRSQTKEERENKTQTEILGNAIYVKDNPGSSNNNQGSQTGGDNPF